MLSLGKASCATRNAPVNTEGTSYTRATTFLLHDATSADCVPETLCAILASSDPEFVMNFALN